MIMELLCMGQAITASVRTNGRDDLVVSTNLKNGDARKEFNDMFEQVQPWLVLITHGNVLG